MALLRDANELGIVLIVPVADSEHSLYLLRSMRFDNLTLWLRNLHFGHRGLREEALSHNPVEESGECSLIMVDSPWRCSTTGGLRPVALDSPPLHLPTYVAQKLPDLPLGEKSSIIGPGFPFRVPQESA